MGIGDMIKQYVNENDMSYRQFAAKAGITNGYISMLINGKNPKSGKPPRPTIETYDKLANAMNITIDELFRVMDDAPVSLQPQNEIPLPPTMWKTSSFSETIKRIRLERHMTQEEFADLLGTTKQNISRYESGAVSPKISTAQMIADKLGISLSALNGNSEPDTDREFWEAREAARRDPDRDVLYKLAKNGTTKDVRQAVALIDALRATNPDFYDGDDPS